ncbi:hypothetical protein [Psychrobacter celer]|uniref:hypothetical protein n=1 Tax=Psychrobacter celer TaxID=306572 RepID=UPI003FD12DDF
MHSNQLFTATSFNRQSAKPSDSTIKSNLEYLKIRPKDIEDIVRDAQNTYKMVFEQVFLVMRYVRYLIEDEQNALAVRGRMNFLMTVFKRQENADDEILDNIRKNILKKLEKDVGSNDIIAYLQTLESNESSAILRGMQENGVAFAPIECVRGQDVSRSYPYYDMYMCLQHPLDIFKMLLKKNNHEASDIERSIYYKIKSHADHVNPKGIRLQSISEEQYQHMLKLDKEGSLAKIVDEYTPHNKDSILSEVRSDIAIELGRWATEVFDKISNPSYGKTKNKLGQKQITFDNSFKINIGSDRTVIDIQSGLVGNLNKINQLDDLFDSIKLAVKAKLKSPKFSGRPHRAEERFNNENALADISAWYDRYSTEMFRRIDQIPKAIVSIIYFDLERGIPSLNHVFRDAQELKNAYESVQEKPAAKKASPVKERNLLITCINSLNLYLNNDKSQDNLNNLIQRVQDKDTLGINNLYRLNNPIMSLWTVFSENKDEDDNLTGSLDASFGETEQEKMMYRFKTVPFFFKRKANIELRELIYSISSQSSTENPVPYPYNSAFPLPLWIRKPSITLTDSADSSIDAEPKSPEIND